MPTLRRRTRSGATARPHRKARAKPADRYHHGDLRPALLEEGKRLLEKQGPSALSLREVARRLGVSHNAPYKHFPTREALLAALAADGFRQLADRTAAGARQDGMHGAGLAYVGFALDHPTVFRLMFSDAIEKSSTPDLQQAAAASFAGLRSRVAAIHGEEAAGMAAVSAWAFVHGLAHLLIDGQLSAGIIGGGTPLEAADRVLRAWNAGGRPGSAPR